MEDGLWENYEDEEEHEPYDRGPITSELELSDSELWEVEADLGFSIDKVFDRYVEGNESDLVGGNTHAAAGTEGGEVVLEAFRDAPASSLAHESVHGILEQDAINASLPGDNPWDQTLYEEFVARKAESRFEEPDAAELELRALTKSRKAYEEAREEYEDFFPDEKTDLNQEISHVEAIENPEINEEVYNKAMRYKQNRDSVLASEAARRHEKDMDLNQLIDPEMETYRNTLQHIKNVDDQIFSEYVDEP